MAQLIWFLHLNIALVDVITKDEFKSKVEEYRESIKSMSEIDRTSTVKEKTGVNTGAFAINPVNNKKIPIWIADYVLTNIRNRRNNGCAGTG